MLRLIVPLVWVWACLWTRVDAHGRLVDPPARSTMWRLGFDTPINYNDHELYCGGFTRQWVQNRGRCGECGDPWDLPRPRPQETGGTYGTSQLSRVYRKGQVVKAKIHLTVNHSGWFEFRVCAVNDSVSYVRQSCLNQHVLPLADHSGTRYHLNDSRPGLFRVRLRLPSGLTCSRCVLQWHYTTGNNWGFCKNGSSQQGCGRQEVFRGCSDIAIFASDNPSFSQFLNLTTAPDLSAFLQLKDTMNYLSTKDSQHLSVLPDDLVDPQSSEDEDEDEILNAHLPVIDNNHVEATSREHSVSLKSQHTPTSTSTTTFHPSFDILGHTRRDHLHNSHKGPEQHHNLAQRQSITAITTLKKHIPSEASLEVMGDLPSAQTLSLPDTAETPRHRGLFGPSTDSPAVTPIPKKSRLVSPRPQNKLSTTKTTHNSDRSLHGTATHRPLFTSSATIPERINKQNKDDNRDAKNLPPLTLKLMRGSPKMLATAGSRVSPMAILQIGRDQRLLLQKAITLATSTAASRKGVPIVVILG